VVSAADRATSYYRGARVRCRRAQNNSGQTPNAGRCLLARPTRQPGVFADIRWAIHILAGGRNVADACHDVAWHRTEDF